MVQKVLKAFNINLVNILSAVVPVILFIWTYSTTMTKQLTKISADIATINTNITEIKAEVKELNAEVQKIKITTEQNKLRLDYIEKNK